MYSEHSHRSVLRVFPGNCLYLNFNQWFTWKLIQRKFLFIIGVNNHFCLGSVLNTVVRAFRPGSCSVSDPQVLYILRTSVTLTIVLTQRSSVRPC